MGLGKKLISIMFLVFFLQACGGGGDDTVTRDTTTSTNPTPPATTTLSIALSIVERDSGTASNDLSATTPLTVIATVTNSDGAVQADELVTFTFSVADLATFDPASGTALTDAQGVARIDLIVGQTAGAGQVVATLDSSETAQIGFNSAGPGQAASEEPASLELFANSVQLPSSGSDQIELIALVRNEQNILMEGVDVSFSANASSALQVTQGTTAADGTARAMLSTVNNPENREVTVTAQVGSANILTQQLVIDVIGTAVNINGPASVIINDPAPLTIVLVDSDGAPITNQSLVLTTTSGTLSESNPTTGSTGQVTVNYTAQSAGSAVITANALNAESSITVTAQADDFSFTLPTMSVPLNQATDISVTWLRNNTPFVGGDITFTSSRGVIASPMLTTDASGVAMTSIQSSNAGVASISAEGRDGAGNVVTARGEITFIATQAATIVMDASPDNIGPNGQTSTISAVVRDVNGNLVTGQTVNFSVDDVSGGSITPNTSVTDSNGIASTVYTSSSVSSEDAVIIRAEVANTPAVNEMVTLTVGNRAFDIVLGTGRDIQLPDPSSYLKQFAVFVSDSAGRPVANVDLTVSGTPVRFTQGGTYRKGFWMFDSDANVWVAMITAVCPNEDVNGNGLLDAGEDTNGDGTLTPGIVSTVAFANGQTETDNNGQATVELRYPREFGPWTDVQVSVFGQSAGTESQESQNFELVVAAEDVSDEASPPPANPYGEGFLCTNTN
ncbi:invasin [Alteromonadaceae bacterium M269]|nr:invasin [Alteromonadaceae bacterium M269]